MPGTSTAYWGPQVKIGPVQPALKLDMDAYTNVESLHFTFDQEKNKIPLVYTYISGDRHQHSDSDSADQSAAIRRWARFRRCPTNLLPPDLKPFRDDMSKLPIPQAIMMGLAAGRAERRGRHLRRQSLDVTRYGGVLSARKLVGVRGAGPAFDGLYYVKSVTHKIKRGEYKQNFTLTRNGLVSTVPTVNP